MLPRTALRTMCAGYITPLHVCETQERIQLPYASLALDNWYWMIIINISHARITLSAILLSIILAWKCGSDRVKSAYAHQNRNPSERIQSRSWTWFPPQLYNTYTIIPGIYLYCTHIRSRAIFARADIEPAITTHVNTHLLIHVNRVLHISRPLSLWLTAL